MVWQSVRPAAAQICSALRTVAKADAVGAGAAEEAVSAMASKAPGRTTCIE